MQADRFASIVSGKIVTLTEATPPHELLPHQIPLTLREYKVLHASSDLDELEEVIKSIRNKIASLGE